MLRCKTEDILLEMDRILRPEGAVILRDQVDVMNKVRKVARAMRWDTRLVDHEGGRPTRARESSGRCEAVRGRLQWERHCQGHLRTV